MKTIFTLTLFLMTAGPVCAAQTGSQSLADIAKQNRQNKQAVHVITENDIAASGGVVSVVGDESAQAASPAPASPQKASAENKPASSTDTNTRVTDLKKKLDSYKAEQQTWKDSAKRDEGLAAKATDDFRRTTYQEALENDKKSVAIVQQKIDQTNAELVKAQQAAPAGQSTTGSKPPSALPSSQ